MSEAPRARTPEDGRLSTGTPQLDEMLSGGLMPHRPYLVVGPSGTGKTTLALEFLCEGVRNHEPTLIVTMEEPPNEMRFNHRSLQPELDQVWVFDAIPDVMRYERAPFKDVAQVRDAVPFSQVAPEIRKTPELSSVEITLTSLEQTLKMQSARRNYTRLVIDSLTALQYFCMKGIDEVQGAQSFLRFLSDLGPTTLLTVESPHEDVETPERMLARGEIRLFRWELEGQTVRAIGVEKFRGSSHDVRLHPYRIGRNGVDVNLSDTISRDTRRTLQARAEGPPDEHVAPIFVTLGGPGGSGSDPVSAALDGIAAEIEELKAARLDLATIRGALDNAHIALSTGQHGSAQASLVEVRALVHQMALGHWSSRPDRAAGGPAPVSVPRPPPDLPPGPMGGEDLHRSVAHLARAIGPLPTASTSHGPSTSDEPPAPPAPVPEPLPALADLAPRTPPESAPPTFLLSPPPTATPEPSSTSPPVPESEPAAPSTEIPPAAVAFGPTFESLAPPPADRPVTEATAPPEHSGEPETGPVVPGAPEGGLEPAVAVETQPTPPEVHEVRSEPAVVPEAGRGAGSLGPAGELVGPPEEPSASGAPKRRRKTTGATPRRRAKVAAPVVPSTPAVPSVPAEPPSGEPGAPAAAPTDPPVPKKRAARKRKVAPVPSSPTESSTPPPAESSDATASGSSTTGNSSQEPAQETSPTADGAMVPPPSSTPTTEPPP